MAETFESVARKFRRLARRGFLPTRWAKAYAGRPAQIALQAARRAAPVRSGRLRGSLRTETRKISGGAELAIVSDLPYARIIEEGGTVINRTGGRVRFSPRGYMRAGIDKAASAIERASLDVIEREVLR